MPARGEHIASTGVLYDEDEWGNQARHKATLSPGELRFERARLAHDRVLGKIV
jgi:hypothetical protein